MLFIAIEAEKEREKGVTSLRISRKAREIKITNLPALQSPVYIAHAPLSTFPPTSQSDLTADPEHSWSPSPFGMHMHLYFSWQEPPSLPL